VGGQYCGNTRKPLKSPHLESKHLGFDLILMTEPVGPQKITSVFSVVLVDLSLIISSKYFIMSMAAQMGLQTKLHGESKSEVSTERQLSAFIFNLKLLRTSKG